MSRVVLVGGTPDLAERLRAAHPALQLLGAGRLPVEPKGLLEQLPDGDLPEVVVFGPAAPMDDVLALAHHVDGAWPGISMVFAATPTPELWPTVMRAGIREVVAPDADVQVLRDALDRATKAALGRRSSLRPDMGEASAPGRVIAVVSPKGGAGKTTVSTNLAVGLAAAAPQSAVVVDLDVQFGDVATALGLVPEYTLPDVVHGRASEDSMVLKTFLTQHRSGLFAVCGSDSPAAGDTVTGEDVTRLLTSLARQFRYVVVDTSPGLSEQTLAALDRATDAVLLTSMDVPGVRGLRREMDVLAELGLLPLGRHLVLNFADARGALTLSDVETALGTKADVVLPRSPAVPASTNEGVPLLQSNRGREPATKGMRRLLDRFVAAPAPQSSGFWSRQRTAS